ncbi:hypothetical protein [Anaerococcus tetradius]|uniref:hypothetical protein n=1 Tax=Anaerococcus tetradius TaxID=33036 RepID=UPI0023F5966E|nr:hypothetical protein [Anaerococcus tetradius]
MEEYLKEQGKKFNIENYFKPESYTIPNALGFAIDEDKLKQNKGNEFEEEFTKSLENAPNLESVSLLGKSSGYNLFKLGNTEASIDLDHEKLIDSPEDAISIGTKAKISDKFALKSKHSFYKQKLSISQTIVESKDKKVKFSQDMGLALKSPNLSSDNEKDDYDLEASNKFALKVGDFKLEQSGTLGLLSENSEKFDFDFSYEPEDPNIAQKALLESIRTTSILKNFALMDSSSNEKSNKNEEGINNDIALY